MRIAHRRFGRLAALTAALVLLGLMLGRPMPAHSESAQGGSRFLSISFTVRPAEMVAPGDVTMTFVITNITNYDIQNVYLSSGDGLLSEPIGQIAAGETQTLVRPHTVTQDELDAGYIAYSVTHDPLRPGAEKVTHSLRAPIVKGEAKPSVDFTRQLSSAAVPKGGQLTITYRLHNTGNVALTNVRIRDSLGDFTGRAERLEVGDSKTFISRVTLAGEAVSSPTLEYSVPSGQGFTLALEATSIPLAASHLDAAFSVGRSVFAPDTADAILTLTNTGNTDYLDLVVTDDVYGGVIADALSLPRGSGPAEVPFTYPVRGESEFRWHITGRTSAGERLDLYTDTVTLPAPQETPAAVITLQAAARTPNISRPGGVTFDFSIANDGNAMAREAVLYEVERGDVRHLAALATGEPMRFSTSYEVAEDSQFIFCLNYIDPEGRQRTVSTQPIDVTISSAGVAPERTSPAGLGLSGQSVKPASGSTASFTILLIVAGTALVVLFTVLAAASLKSYRDRKARAAEQRQRLREELGKTNPFRPVKQQRSGKGGAAKKRKR